MLSNGVRGKLAGCVVLIVLILASAAVLADDCKRISNILILFDASGAMKERDTYEALFRQMGFFDDAIPITRDGFFNVGLRHYGLKVGMGCESTESILAIQPWDPERFLNSFPRTVSHGRSCLSAGLRAAADDVAAADGKTIIIVIGGGNESCAVDPVKIAEQMCRNNPDLEIHTFQVGTSQEGRFFLKAIASKGRGTYTDTNAIASPAQWHAWMREHLVVPCAPPAPAPGVAPPQAAISPVTFDFNSFSVKSVDPVAAAANLSSLEAVGTLLREDPAAAVILHGYSDGKGSPEQNLRISQKRAEAVKRYLTATYGIPPARIKVVGHGAGPAGSQPLQGPQERLGRRVEFQIVK